MSELHSLALNQSLSQHSPHSPHSQHNQQIQTGATLICYGLAITPFFESLEETNVIAIGFGGAMFIPMIVWFFYLCAPNLNLKVFELERKKRTLISMQRMERGAKNFFNKMQDDAAEATKPQPRVVKFMAHIRKHDYQIMATTW